MINDIVQHIQEATNADPVWKELEDHGNNERVCEAALRKLWALADVVSDFGVEDVLGQGSADTILDVMTSNEGNEAIQLHECHILERFIHVEAASSALVSDRCINTIFAAMASFPDSSQVQEAVLSAAQHFQMGMLGGPPSLFYKFIAAGSRWSFIVSYGS